MTNHTPETYTPRPGDRVEITAVQSYEITWDDTADRLVGLTGVLIAVNDSGLRENERTGALDRAPFEVRIDRDAEIDAGEIVFAAGVRPLAPSMSVVEAEAALAPLEAAVRAGRQRDEAAGQAPAAPTATDVHHMLARMRADAATHDIGHLLQILARWAASSEGRDALLNDLVAAGYRLPHAYGKCEDVDPPAPTDTAAVRAALRDAADAVFALDYDEMVSEQDDENLGSMREAWDLGTIHATELLRRLADETQDTQPAADTCAHCGAPIRLITGTLAAWWVHDPGGNTVCDWARAAASTRATPKPAVRPDGPADTPTTKEA
jgi:hypothetical protein